MAKEPFYKKFIFACMKKSAVKGDDDNAGPSGGPSGGSSAGPSRVPPHAPVDRLLWSRDNGVHAYGEFSIAIVQANALLEDQCDLESGFLNLDEDGLIGTFVGIYDGHGGPEAARFVNDRLFENIKRYTSENEGMAPEVIQNAYLATEEEFLSLVESQWLTKPRMASVGTCCLVGIVCNGRLYIANSGDSRAVLGKKVGESVNAVKAVRISEEHNASIVSVREELRALHPNDPNIVSTKNGVWRVRGLIQISRSIGDAYLKRFDFNRPPLLPKYKQSEPFNEPILKAEPAIHVQEITREDQFVIFASDGLWEHLSDQDAVDIVKSSPREGIARALVKAAVVVAGRNLAVSHPDLVKIEKGTRRRIHDDITVIVLFLDSNSEAQSSSAGPMALSVKNPLTL